ncbi:Nucleolar Complex 2 protein [Microbotryomycetes sp. JL221]|nr:Nucleolar Complex 2 protein [Microbotryomycetes sp. JL221]
MAKQSKAKQTKSFLKKGLLDKQIKQRQERRAFQQKVKQRQIRRNKGPNKPSAELNGQPGSDDDDRDDDTMRKLDVPDKLRRTGAADSDSDDDEDMDVDAVLAGAGLDDNDKASGDDDDDDADDAQDGADDKDFSDDDLSNLSDDDSSVNSTRHVADLKALAEKDPEFYKYLQENDAELLDFDETADQQELDDEEEDDEVDDDDEDEDEDEPMTKSAKGKERAAVQEQPVLTKAVLRSMQRSVLETRSFRSLRRLLLAFRSAANSGLNDAEAVETWQIESSSVFNKLVTTALKYTPVVLAQQVPYTDLNGKYKNYATAQRLIKSYFVSLQALLRSVASDSDIPAMAVNESAKLIPWIVGNRKVARRWIEMLLSLYDSSTDEVRIAAFLALRKLAIAGDHSLRESLLKGAYATLLSSCRQTSIYTLPSITLMKNSASELFLLPGRQEQDLSYQLAFQYIRMLAILLRKGVKQGTKDAFKSVYNWQFVHAIDFWSIVLSSACDKERAQLSGENPLQPLLYPLIQVGLGAIRLVPTSRYYPLRFHLVRALLRVVQRTGTYIPLATPLFEVLDSPELTKRTKPSTLKPLDWEYYLKCPTAYQRTRIYADSLGEEVVYLLSEFYGSLGLSIALPELVLPGLVALKRHVKKTPSPKLSSQLKSLIERLEAQSKWIEERREKVEFAPNKRDKVDRFLLNEDKEKTPLGGFVKLQRKVKEQKRATLERAAQGEGEDL